MLKDKLKNFRKHLFSNNNIICRCNYKRLPLFLTLYNLYFFIALGALLLLAFRRPYVLWRRWYYLPTTKTGNPFTIDNSAIINQTNGISLSKIPSSSNTHKISGSKKTLAKFTSSVCSPGNFFTERVGLIFNAFHANLHLIWAALSRTQPLMIIPSTHFLWQLPQAYL